MNRNRVVYEVVVISLYRALMSAVREQGLDHDHAEEVFRSARHAYSQNPYNTAIVWGTPLDERGEAALRQKYKTLLGQWLFQHGLSDGLAGLLHQYLRDEIVEQLTAVARRNQHDILQPLPELSAQGRAATEDPQSLSLSA